LFLLKGLETEQVTHQIRQGLPRQKETAARQAISLLEPGEPSPWTLSSRPVLDGYDLHLQRDNGAEGNEFV
jgi:hypothetical protein